jgi:hypothetical protein
MSTDMKSERTLWGPYECPLDGSPLVPSEDCWICPHDNGKSGRHETLLAYDTQQEETVEVLVKGIQPVALD